MAACGLASNAWALGLDDFLEPQNPQIPGQHVIAAAAPGGLQQINQTGALDAYTADGVFALQRAPVSTSDSYAWNDGTPETPIEQDLELGLDLTQGRTTNAVGASVLSANGRFNFRIWLYDDFGSVVTLGWIWNDAVTPGQPREFVYELAPVVESLDLEHIGAILFDVEAAPGVEVVVDSFYTTTVVPEPGSAWLVGSGLVWLGRPRRNG